MTTRTIKATKGLISDVSSYAVLIILQVVLAPLVLNIAGQEVLGAYGIVMQIIGYGLILDLGISVALTRYLSQIFGAIDNDRRFEEIFNVGRYFIFLTNALMALLIIMVFALGISKPDSIILVAMRQSIFLSLNSCITASSAAGFICP